MIFERVELLNFRQFSNKQELRIASDDNNNVTVIHGYNGSGKTTLLNAFVWLFYQDFTPDFTDTSLLVNEGEWNKLNEGQSIDVYVKCIFTHGDTRYIAKRKRTVEKLSGGARDVKKRGELTLRYFDDDGELRDKSGPQDAIEQLLPKPLYPFFFFNGERIEQLANPSAYDQVENGVKVLLDIELLDRAIRHLRSGTADHLREEVAKHSGNEGEELNQQREELSARLSRLKEKRNQLRRNQTALEDEREEIDAKLRAQPELAELQKERDEKQDRLDDVKKQIKQVKTDISELVSNDAYLEIGSPVLSEALKVLDEAHEEGELPPPMKRQFVDELLERSQCICGKSLDEGTEERQNVEAWLDKTSPEEIASIATTTRAEITKSLRKRREKFDSKLDDKQKQRERLYRTKRNFEERLSEISSSIDDTSPEEDYQKLESRRREIESKLKDIGIKISEHDNYISEAKSDISDLDDQIKRIKQQSKKGELAQKRLEATENVAEALEKIRNLQQEKLRKDVSATISEVWSDISIKDYDAFLDSQYRLQLTKEIGGTSKPVRGASTGEKQVLSLAFVSSLVKKAKDLAEESSTSATALFTGGEYPLVMDSPFGSLEKDYRRQVADWVPKLAPQIIVIVSETQWRKEVEEEITPSIGEELILECHTPKHKSKKIELHGRKHPYIVNSPDGFERTLVKNIDN
jgi:DNA sulfur modification protein DndD